MEPAVFSVLQDYLKKSSGLVLTPDKGYLLESRLTPLVRQHQLADISALAREVQKGTNRPLLKDVTEAMTTNETSFLRDGKPFDNFKKLMLPELLKRNAMTKRMLEMEWAMSVETAIEAEAVAQANGTCDTPARRANRDPPARISRCPVSSSAFSSRGAASLCGLA